MDERRAIRDLDRLKWVGILLPIGFIWGFQIVRHYILEGAVSPENADAMTAAVMALAVLFFGMAMGALLDRTQKELIRQNRELAAMTAVGEVVRPDQPLDALVRAALDRVIAATGAVAGTARIRRGEPDVAVIRTPSVLGPGLDWATSLLDTELDPVDRATAEVRPDLDATVLRVPLTGPGGSAGPDEAPAGALGELRLLFHPARPPELRDAVVEDLARTIATGIRLERLLADIRGRERQQRALYDVALQLTGRGELRDVLDEISSHARELLAADRAVVCLAEPGTTTRAAARGRLALLPDGTTCTFQHLEGRPDHPRDPGCPLAAGEPGAIWAARPLHEDGQLIGELCVTRLRGPEFAAGEIRLLGALADLAAIAVRTARLRDSEEQVTIVTERERIARELHDSLAQVLGQMHLRLRAVDGAVESAAVRAELADLADTADEAYRDVRESILGLRETIGGDRGLEGALREYLAKYGRQTGLAVALICDPDASHAIEPRAEVQLLRVVQEALTNVRKHAHATRVNIRIAARDGAPSITIEDDGAGFDSSTVGPSMTGGFGLRAMRERVEQVGGTLEVVSAPGAGTRIRVQIPGEGPRDASAASAAPAPGR
jgi:signal transduction histidine kinase